MINLADYKMTDASGVGVYVGTYAKYNSGSLFGMWIDLERVSCADEFFEVCRELHKDEEDPEFMFQDYQGFPEELYHESMSVEDVEKFLHLWHWMTTTGKCSSRSAIAMVVTQQTRTILSTFVSVVWVSLTRSKISQTNARTKSSRV